MNMAAQGASALTDPWVWKVPQLTSLSLSFLIGKIEATGILSDTIAVRVK